MAELTIDGDMFKVEIEGDNSKPTLVLSNSLGTTLALWDAQMPALREHFRVIRYDSRGHGGSAGGRSPCSIRQLGQDVLAIFDALEIDRAHFIGASMGGAVGQWLMVNAPERIERAVLANTAARIGTPDVWNARIKSVLSNGMEEAANSALERWFSPEFSESHVEVIDKFGAMLRNISPQGYAASCAALRDLDLREAIHEVNHPILVITGSHDPAIADKDAAQLLAALPNATHVQLAARHMSNVEAADNFTEATVQFLTGRTKSRATRGNNVPRSARKPVRGTRRAVARGIVPARAPVSKAGPTKTSATRASTSRTTRATPLAKAEAPSRASGRKAASSKAAPTRALPSTVRRSATRTKVAALPREKTAAESIVTPKSRPAGKSAAAIPPAGKRAPSKTAPAKVATADLKGSQGAAATQNAGNATERGQKAAGRGTKVKPAQTSAAQTRSLPAPASKGAETKTTAAKSPSSKQSVKRETKESPPPEQRKTTTASRRPKGRGKS